MNTPKMLGILDLLELYGLEKRTNARLVRHKTSQYDMDQLARQGWLETYQSYQTNPEFDGCPYIISFRGLSGTRALFEGVYSVRERKSVDEVIFPEKCPYKEWQHTSSYYYVLEKDPRFEPLEQRLVIEWGKGVLAWVQKLRNKAILEILPAGQTRPPFEDYLEFYLTYNELVDIVSQPEAHKEWRARLSAVAGIYLVLDTVEGRQYVGSAHGQQGVWGRWQNYVGNGHGGNKELQKLVSTSSDYPEALNFTLLHVLSKTLSKQEVLKWEQLFKEKLGTRASGLNRN